MSIFVYYVFWEDSEGSLFIDEFSTLFFGVTKEEEEEEELETENASKPRARYSRVVHQTQTQRGAKSGNIILEGSGLNICPTRLLYMSFINCGSRDQNQGPIHTGSQVLSPKYDMDAYMATLFEGEAWELC